jgi:hypothetical protein
MVRGRGLRVTRAGTGEDARAYIVPSRITRKLLKKPFRRAERVPQALKRT